MGKWTAEDLLQSHVVRAVRRHCLLTEVRPWALQLSTLHSTPNGFKIPRSQQDKFKATGALAHYPDLTVDGPGSMGAVTFHGLQIEMKTPTGQVKKGQREMHDKLRSLGQFVVVCRAAREAVRIIYTYVGMPADLVDRLVAEVPAADFQGAS